MRHQPNTLHLLSHHFLCILIETCDTGATPKTPYFSPPVPISCRVTRDRLFTPVPPFLVNINRDLRHGCDTKPPYSSPPIPISSRVTREPSLFWEARPSRRSPQNSTRVNALKGYAHRAHCLVCIHMSVGSAILFVGRLTDDPSSTPLVS